MAWPGNGFYAQTLGMALNDGHHHLVHQIAVDVGHHVCIQQQIISGVGAELAEDVHIASNPRQHHATASLTKLLQTLLHVFIRIAQHISGNRQMQQPRRQRTFGNEVEQLIHQRDAG